ncbi:GNAT family N-acetyltransferase [Intrasporangium sp. YIM S08009]|uniref:GNAT family N-acetyltransferase n=1 Tax=Intrasporangium zincisolvens TaxID=3080018 RepID=UPI002B061BB7|nr:GNAT family N-acetyltransferase [Intrasporangium sp. YIM S08009]
MPTENPPHPPHPGRASRVVRDATAADAADCARIYRPYVLDTAVTFELEPPAEAEVAARIEAAVATHAWLVLEDGGEVVGYAYGGPFKARPAYRWSCEVSVYLDPASHRTGAGRALYTALIERLTERGYRMAAAGIAQPNEASNRLHASFGFEPVGTYRRVGWKNGAWHDVAWVQRFLGEPHVGPEPPPEPR